MLCTVTLHLIPWSQADRQQDPGILLSPSPTHSTKIRPQRFYTGAGDSNSDPQACLTRAPPQAFSTAPGDIVYILKSGRENRTGHYLVNPEDGGAGGLKEQ